MSFNYVWSHFLDDQDSSGWGSRAGPQPYQVANNPSQNYASSNFDVRSAFKGYTVYQIPVGKGRRFLNHNAVLDEVIGGWQVSSTIVLSTGQPFTVYGTQNTYQGAGSAFPNRNPGVSIKPTHRSARCTNQTTGSCDNVWYNAAAFTRPADGTFGNVGRNSLFGPGIEQVNLSGSKTFSLGWEGIQLQIRADAANAFNHASFSAPTGTLSGGAEVGGAYTNTSQQLSGVTVGGRNVQLGARLTF